jgi:hypothetical protein
MERLLSNPLPFIFFRATNLPFVWLSRKLILQVFFRSSSISRLIPETFSDSNKNLSVNMLSYCSKLNWAEVLCHDD